MFFFVNWGSLDFLIESHTTETRDWNFENRLLGGTVGAGVDWLYTK